MEVAFLPRWITRCLSSDGFVSYQLNILISNLILLLVLYLFYNQVTGDRFLPNFCLFDRIIGTECPFCGCSRSLGAFLHADFIDAWRYNRSGILLGVYFIAQLPLRTYLAVSQPGPGSRAEKLSRLAGRTILAVMIINWIINLTRLLNH